MSDFLSRFNKDNYEELNEHGKNDHEQIQEKDVPESQDKKVESPQASGTKDSAEPIEENRSRRQDSEEEYEIDPTYQAKKRKRLIYIIAGSVLAVIGLFIIWYLAVYTEVEDFTDRPVSDARAWASEHDIEIVLSEDYSMDHDANHIINQNVEPGKKIRKGKQLELVSSLGADPEEQIELPDFSEMNDNEAQAWIDENRADNLKLVRVYHDDIEEGEFVEFTLRDSSIDESEYRRKDSATVSYSKGEEVFEKDITVPDFVGGARSEVEQWAETNEIDLTIKESDSNTIEVDHVISQSVEPNEKVAKRDKMKIVVSVGKAFTVPNFNELNMEEAMEFSQIPVIIKQRYHSKVRYGGLISQSVEAGTKLTDQDDQSITVTYSLGQPYLRDYRGMLEGDLPQAFYDDYQSKGADIKYVVKYVDAPEVKGTVVGMSKFNEFVSMSYTVEIRVSKNALAEPSPPSFDDETPIDEVGPVDEEK